MCSREIKKNLITGRYWSKLVHVKGLFTVYDIIIYKREKRNQYNEIQTFMKRFQAG